MKRYIVISILVLIAVAFIAITMKDTSNSEDQSATSTTLAPSVQKDGIPDFEETEETLAIPDPCVMISQESITSFIPQSKVRGPLMQTAVSPTKSCEWFPVDETKSEPRITVSISTSPTYFDSLIASSLGKTEIEQENYIVEGQSNAIGGAPCGRTLLVKIEQYSFVVGVCKASNQVPTNEELSGLAQEILQTFS